MKPSRPGYALVLSLLMTLALAILSLGVLAVGTREHTLAAAVARKAQAEHNAEALALRVVADWSTAEFAPLRPGERRALHRGAVTVERVDAALYRVAARGAVPGPGGPTHATAALAVRTLPLAALRAAVPGALNAVGAVEVEGAGSVAGRPAASSGGAVCSTSPSPAVVAPRLSGTGSVVGTPAAQLVAPPDLPTPDPFGSALALSLATIRYDRRVATPGPTVSAGACAAGVNNWGSTVPGHPCHDALPYVLTGDLRLSGGEGRGILVAHGDLHVTGGARFHGLVVVFGHLRLDDGATIQGAVRAHSATITDGVVTRDACTLNAVFSSRPLDRAFRDPVRWRLPAF